MQYSTYIITVERKMEYLVGKSLRHNWDMGLERRMGISAPGFLASHSFQLAIGTAARIESGRLPRCILYQ
jgi:hypothetical protein